MASGSQVESPASAARLYLARGWQPVPIPGRTKRPRGNEWQIRRYAEADLADFDAIFSPSNNIGLLLGEASHGLVDVDLDCAEAADLARFYLPQTAMVSGRASRPLSHYWYKVDKPKNTLQFRDASRKMLVELRSSDGSKGFQTIVPPSLHEDTLEPIEWVTPDEQGMPGLPAEVNFDELAQRVQVVAAAALLARHFPSLGGRHEFALALGGLLLRYGTPADHAYNFVYEVCRVGGSDDPKTRAETVYSTAKKIEDGEDFTGGRRLIEIIGTDGDKIVNKVCEWLEFTDTKTKWLLGVEEREKNRQEQKEAPSPTKDPVVEETNWVSRLKKDSKDNYLPCAFNIYEILKNMTPTRGCFRWNDVSREIVVTGHFASIDLETLPLKIAHWLTEELDIIAHENDIARQILCIAMENKFDPIKDYLTSLKWDETPRISEDGGWLVTYANANIPDEKTACNYVEFVGRKWLLSMVARAMDPGCKADLVLILEGEQGLRKSTLFEALAGPTLHDPNWYCDLAIAIGDKDSKMLTSGFWLAELPDLAALRRTSDQNIVKAFFSTRFDKFRPPYGKAIQNAPRRLVFGGTTNELQYLSDVTGNRRYCPVRCNREVDIGALLRDRDQIFAEAMYLYNKHVNECEDKLKCCCWWFTKEEEAVQGQQNNQREVESTDREIISAWWVSIEKEKRPEFVTTLDVARGAFGYENDRIPRGFAISLGHDLKKLGFERKHRRVDGNPTWVYEPSEDLKNMPHVEKSKRQGPFKVFKGGRG